MNSLRVARWPYRVTDPAPTYTTPRDVNDMSLFCSIRGWFGGVLNRLHPACFSVFGLSNDSKTWGAEQGAEQQCMGTGVRAGAHGG